MLYRHYSSDSSAGNSPTRSSSPQGSTPGEGLPPRELIFACQFHTCAVADYTLSFTRQELDSAWNGKLVFYIYFKMYVGCFICILILLQIQYLPLVKEEKANVPFSLSIIKSMCPLSLYISIYSQTTIYPYFTIV